jgi:truncated hemoglobin YjbI
VQTAVTVVTELFVDRLLADPKVKHFFARVDRDAHIRHLSGFVAMALGKPDAKYNFSKRGVDSLARAHAGLGITSADFDVVASHLQACFEVRASADTASASTRLRPSCTASPVDSSLPVLRSDRLLCTSDHSPIQVFCS